MQQEMAEKGTGEMAEQEFGERDEVYEEWREFITIVINDVVHVGANIEKKYPEFYRALLKSQALRTEFLESLDMLELDLSTAQGVSADLPGIIQKLREK